MCHIHKALWTRAQTRTNTRRLCSIRCKCCSPLRIPNPPPPHSPPLIRTRHPPTLTCNVRVEGSVGLVVLVRAPLSPSRCSPRTGFTRRNLLRCVWARECFGEGVRGTMLCFEGHLSCRQACTRAVVRYLTLPRLAGCSWTWPGSGTGSVRLSMACPPPGGLLQPFACCVP